MVPRPSALGQIQPPPFGKSAAGVCQKPAIRFTARHGLSSDPFPPRLPEAPPTPLFRGRVNFCSRGIYYQLGPPFAAPGKI